MSKEPKPIYSGPEIPYHRDKNGQEIKYCKVRHDCGKIYDIYGTGLKMPGDGYSLLAWNEDNKLVFLDTRDVVVHDESIGSDLKQMVIVFGTIVAVLLPVAITAKLSFGW